MGGRPRIDPERVRAGWSACLTDPEIAAEIGCSRFTIRDIRTRLGLRPHGLTAPGPRAAMADRMRRQLAAAGVRTLRQLSPGDPHRVARNIALATSYGLPADLTPVQVRVLVALASGPMTTAALAVECGRALPNQSEGYHAFNSPKTATGNHLADLKRRGLVAFTGRRGIGRANGRHGGACPGLYMLTALAMDHMTGAAG